MYISLFHLTLFPLGIIDQIITQINHCLTSKEDILMLNFVDWRLILKKEASNSLDSSFIPPLHSASMFLGVNFDTSISEFFFVLFTIPLWVVVNEG